MVGFLDQVKFVQRILQIKCHWFYVLYIGYIYVMLGFPLIFSFLWRIVLYDGLPHLYLGPQLSQLLDEVVCGAQANSVQWLWGDLVQDLGWGTCRRIRVEQRL